MIDPLRWRTASRYRTIDEASIVDQIWLQGWDEHPVSRDTESFAEAATVLDRLVALGLPYREQGGRRLFDPVEVGRLVIAAGVTGLDPYWLTHRVESARRRYRIFAGTPPIPRRFRIVQTRRWARPNGPRLRLPVALDIAQQRRDGWTMLDDGGLSWRLGPGGDRVEARPTALPDNFSATLEMAITTTGELDTDPGPLDLYLKAEEGWIATTDRVRALADRLARGMPPRRAVERFWDHLLDTVQVAAVHYDEFGDRPAVDVVLEDGWTDCLIGSALMASLCRAVGIPARIVGGHFLYPMIPTAHYWAEIWFDGAWRPYDLMRWTLSDAGRVETWRHPVDGVVEPRFITQVFPLRFTGLPGTAMPSAWQMVARPAPGRLSIAMRDSLSGDPLYTDELLAEQIS